MQLKFFYDNSIKAEGNLMSESIISIIASCSTIFASAVTLIIVVLGYNKWKQEYTQKKKIELAEEVLEKSYLAKEAIESIRFVAWDRSEAAERPKDTKEKAEDQMILDQLYVYRKRIKNNLPLINELLILRYRYSIAFPKHNSKKWFINFKEAVIAIQVTLRELAYEYCPSEQKKMYSEESLKEFHKYKESLEEIIYDVHTPDDPINLKIDESIQGFECVLQEKNNTRILNSFDRLHNWVEKNL
ncbi:MAG TPA: hypothetical protein DCM28_09400 [Phycisphaerales bacterium]|nr:hypothetical protein [Phycisphaerales bacterium]HCD32561.1 hypothetical protein [Phycisphaerales bacterium]